MKVIKTLVTLSIINAVTVIGVVASRGVTNVTVVSPSPAVYSTGFNNDTLLRSLSPSILPSPTPTASIIETTKSSNKPSGTPVSTPTQTPTPPPSVTPTPTPKPISGCIVTIDGVSYNVEPLRSTHSGGDIFECGTDMSAVFWREHNNRILQKMQKYKI